METIYNYFDHMFLSLPATPEVEKAKEELLGMAEDRYLDLKEQGKVKMKQWELSSKNLETSMNLQKNSTWICMQIQIPLPAL